MSRKSRRYRRKSKGLSELIFFAGALGLLFVALTMGSPDEISPSPVIQMKTSPEKVALRDSRIDVDSISQLASKYSKGRLSAAAIRREISSGKNIRSRASELESRIPTEIRNSVEFREAKSQLLRSMTSAEENTPFRTYSDPDGDLPFGFDVAALIALAATFFICLTLPKGSAPQHAK